MDVSDFTFNGPGDPGNYTVDAWLMGLKLGVIGSSDNHGSQPGKEGFGTMAVWASALTREAVFDAIRNRRTYGTTGSRIYLEFVVNGEPMGGETTVAADQPVSVHVEALGTGPLRWIHLLRADLDRPDSGVQCRPPGVVPRQQRAARFQPRIGPTTHHRPALSTTCACASATSSTAASPRPGAAPCG